MELKSGAAAGTSLHTLPPTVCSQTQAASQLPHTLPTVAWVSFPLLRAHL